MCKKNFPLDWACKKNRRSTTGDRTLRVFIIICLISASIGWLHPKRFLTPTNITKYEIKLMALVSEITGLSLLLALRVKVTKEEMELGNVKCTAGESRREKGNLSPPVGLDSLIPQFRETFRVWGENERIEILYWVKEKRKQKKRGKGKREEKKLGKKVKL